MKRSDFFTMENGILHITSNAHTYPLSTLIRTELLLRPLSHNNLNLSSSAVSGWDKRGHAVNTKACHSP